MLVNPRELLIEARAGGWAVGGFNFYNLESARACLDAAVAERAPVLLQTSSGAVAHLGLHMAVAIVRTLAAAVAVPVALHLDHGKEPELSRAAVDAGYTSVMIDASALPFDENVEVTRGIVEYAHARGVHVEAELGTLGGIEDAGDVDVESTLTEPEDARRFVAATGVDALAIAIGTSHGATKFTGEPQLDFARLEAISAAVPIPLVLHGASAVAADEVAVAERYGARLPDARGVPDAMLQRAVGLGIAKVNTDSDLRLAALAALRRTLAERPDLFNMYQLMGDVEDAIEVETIARIRLLGSSAKATNR